MKQHLLFLCCVVLFFYTRKDISHRSEHREEKNNIIQQDSITIKTEYGTFTYKKTWYDFLAEKYHAREDSVYIKSYEGDVALDKGKFNGIVDGHPEFFQEEILSPMETYIKTKRTLSEAGIDWYFMLYAHFLRQRYDAKKHEEEKHHIKTLFLNSIELSGLGPYGSGTYHAHERARADAKAEYQTYKLSIDGMQLGSEAEFKKDKAAYIKSLWRHLEKGGKEGFGVGDLIESGDYDWNDFYKQGERAISVVDSLLINSFYLETLQKM